MAVGNLIKSGSVAALAAALAVIAAPAIAQERGGWGGRGGGDAAATQNGGNNGSGSGWRGGGNGRGGGWRGSDGSAGNRSFRSEQSGGAATSAPVEARPQRNWSRGDSSTATGGNTRWQGRSVGDGNRWSGSRNRPADQAQAVPVQPQSGQIEAQRRAWNGTGQSQSRDRDRAAANQNWRNDGNSNWRNNERQSFSRNWNRDWRRDNRYDWRGWRSSNRDVFRLGTYYSPYRNYSYRRLSSGFYLDTLFFGSRYWINDPWQYRLPPAYGPYRWIRYYDDALLVDTYSGEVVDVIYDFFW